MTLPHPARLVLMLAMLGILSGCATGSSLSLSQAPLSFVLTDDGSYEIAAQNDGTLQALAERGDIERGVPGYDVLGGNALLPVSAVVSTAALTPVSGVGALGPTLVSVAATPGQAAVNADLAGQVQVAVTANAASAPAPTATVAISAPVLTNITPVAAAPIASAVTATAPITSAVTAAPIAGPVAAPVVTAANQSLTAVSSVLGVGAPPAAPAATAPNNPILATLAAALGKRCC